MSRLCSKDVTVVFQRGDSYVLKMWQLCSKDANFNAGMFDTRKIRFFSKKNVSIIFCRAHILIYKVIINHYWLPLSDPLSQSFQWFTRLGGKFLNFPKNSKITIFCLFADNWLINDFFVIYVFESEFCCRVAPNNLIIGYSQIVWTE